MKSKQYNRTSNSFSALPLTEKFMMPSNLVLETSLYAQCVKTQHEILDDGKKCSDNHFILQYSPSPVSAHYKSKSGKLSTDAIRILLYQE